MKQRTPARAVRIGGSNESTSTRKWIETTIGEISSSSSGTTPARSLFARYYAGGTIPWVKTLDLNNSELWQTDERVTPTALKETSLHVNPCGSVLVAMYGGFNQIGRTGLLRTPAAVNQAITAISADNDVVDPRYLLNVLNYRVGYWRSVASSSRKDPNITREDVRRFCLELPPLNEQRAIADALGDVDALLGALDRLIAKKRNLKQAAMQQLLTARTRLSGFAGEWESTRIGELATVDPENLPATTGPHFAFDYISLECVDNGRLRQVIPTMFNTAPSRARRVLRHGDVLMATVRPNLKAHLLFRGGLLNPVCSTGFAVLRPDRDVCDPAYLFTHLFADPINIQINALLAGSNYPAINSQDVTALTVPCPPTVEEQTAIATVLSDMDAEIAALEVRQAKTRDMKQAMMQELLTGKTRLI